MSIIFNQIPLTLNTPGAFVEFDSSRAVKGVATLPHDSLLIGQMTSAGTATAGQVCQPRSPSEAAVLFGATSQLSHMVAAYRAYDSLTPLFCIPLADNGGGVAATGNILFTGPATEAGQCAMYIGGRRVAFSIASGDTAATMETNALAAFAADTQSKPVTAAGDAGTGIDFTAVNKGTQGNQIFLGVNLLPGERMPAGTTATVTAMASGATDTDYTSAFTAMASDQYHTVAVGLASATVLPLLVTKLEANWGPLLQIEGHGFAAWYDTAANLVTKGGTVNSANISLIGAEKSALLPLPWELAAQSAAASAMQAQVDPARAMTGLSFAGFSAPPRGARMTRAERDSNLAHGVSTVMAGSDGRLAMERFVTTYQTNGLSLADKSYMDLTTVRTLAALRYSARVRISSKFGRFKLADDGNEIAGQPIVTPSAIRAELLVLFLDWQDLGWVENYAQFAKELLVERDGGDPNRVNAILPPDLINNLLVFAGQIQFIR